MTVPMSSADGSADGDSAGFESLEAADLRPSRPQLSERDRAILDFEQRAWNGTGAKEEAMRVELGLSAARYYQLLNALIDSSTAIVHEPMLVRRLQRVRDSRISARAMRIGQAPVHRAPQDGSRRGSAPLDN